MQVVHEDHVCIELELGKSTQFVPASKCGAVMAVRMYKATCRGPYGDDVPVVALEYGSGITEMVSLTHE